MVSGPRIRLLAWISCWSAGLGAVAGADQDVAVHAAGAARPGAALYAQQCAACHGKSLEGGTGPALTGLAFDAMVGSQHLTSGSLLAVIARTMPLSAPGSLTPAQYAALTAFIVQHSGVLAAAGAQSDEGAQRVASQGVYTDAQRSQGQALYGENCLQCHGGELEGVEDAPPLVGTLFIGKWGGLPVGTLHAFIDKQMPPGNGGALGAVSEAAIVAYILSRNHFPSGSMPLPADPTGLHGIVLQ
jgi:mono/diheme cytochrome c family protein